MIKGLVIALALAAICIAVIVHLPWAAVFILLGWAGGYFHGRTRAETGITKDAVKRAVHHGTDYR